MSSSYIVIKQYPNNQTVKEQGEGHIRLEDIHISSGLERLEIIRFVGDEIFGKVKRNVYFFGTELPKEKVEGRFIIHYYTHFKNKDNIDRYVLTDSGTVYALKKRDKVLSHKKVINCRYNKYANRETRSLD